MSTANDPIDDTDDESLQPSRAVRIYLQTREGEVSESTLQAHRYRLRHFIRFCVEHGIHEMGAIDGRVLHEYRLWRRDDGDLNSVTLHSQLSTLRVFIKFLENIDAVEKDTHEKLIFPSLSDGEDRRETVLSTKRANQIAEWLGEYEYASFDHALFTILWSSGMRIGEARALDVDDFYPRKEQLHVRHRPRGGTALKNGENGERIVALKEGTCQVLSDYIERTRRDVTDDNDREPLLTTAQGRPTTSTLRRHVYRISQPCQRCNTCPHDRDMDSCDAKGYSSTANCPSTVAPHDVRRGAVTHWLSSDVPGKVVGDRMNVSQDILEKHYDKRSLEGRSEQRRQYLDDV